jgi:hypothetical protein
MAVSLDITGIGSVADILGKVFDKVSHYIPDPQQKAEAQQKLAEMAQAEEFKQIDAVLSAAQQQADINKQEAASNSLFVAGWRPFVGWVCGFALAYAAIVDPLARFSAEVIFKYTGAFPLIDTTVTMQVLFGMLGLGAMRSFDKSKGTGSGH